jgi:AraC-like DNA-binding protein
MGDEGGSAALQHDSVLGRWERAWHRPSAPLRGLVEGYHGYRQRLAVPAVHRGVPSAVLPLVVSFGSEQTITPSGRVGASVTVGSFVSGLHDTPVLIDAPEFHGIQVDLRPVAGLRLLGLPPHEFTGRTVELDAVFGADAQRLVDDLACAPDWTSRFRRLDGWLLRRLATGPSPDPEVVQVWSRIVATRGRVGVGSLAEEVGWSARRLRGRVGEQLGMPPKRLARLSRFEHVAQLLSQPGPHDLATIALVGGYYDQAHLSNETRAFSGLTAKELISGHLPDHGGVFDLGADDHDRAVPSKTARPSPS